MFNIYQKSLFPYCKTVNWSARISFRVIFHLLLYIFIHTHIYTHLTSFFSCEVHIKDCTYLDYLRVTGTNRIKPCNSQTEIQASNQQLDECGDVEVLEQAAYADWPNGPPLEYTSPPRHSHSLSIFHCLGDSPQWYWPRML